MLSAFDAFRSQIGIVFLVLLMTGCSLASTQTSVVETPGTTATRNSLSATPGGAYTLVGTFSPTEIEAATSLPTSLPVVFTANTGNLNIRRGPGISYNPISVLRDGQSAAAQGRDFLEEWILIGIPSSPGKTGWVRSGTQYSLITGNVSSLPEVVVDFAVPAYIRNCTQDGMVLQPGDIQVQGLQTFPDNDARVYPGEYRVYDVEEDWAEVMKVEIKEGMLADIQVDGNSDKHKCP